jgi:hypothetical protein
LSDVIKLPALFPVRRGKVVHDHYSWHFPLFPTRNIIAIQFDGERDQAALRESLRKAAHEARSPAGLPHEERDVTSLSYSCLPGTLPNRTISHAAQLMQDVLVILHSVRRPFKSTFRDLALVFREDYLDVSDAAAFK